MVDRFDGPPLMQPYKNGDFVRYSDYAELEAENERLRQSMVDLALSLNSLADNQVSELEAENARLRKALGALDRMSRGVDWCDQDEQARRWEAARL